MPGLKASGIDSTAQYFERLVKKAPEVSKKAGKEALLMLHQNTPSYPAPPQGSSYRRTMQLGRSITTLAGRGKGALSTVNNLGVGRIRAVWGTNIEYAGWVIDKDNQASVHKGRWYTLQDIFNKNQQNIVNIFVKHFERLIRLG